MAEPFVVTVEVVTGLDARELHDAVERALRSRPNVEVRRLRVMPNFSQ